MVPGGWVGSSSGLSGYSIDAATSPDGQQIVFADGFGQVKLFGPSGWTNAYVPAYSDLYVRNSVAFTQTNKPAILYQSYQSPGLTLSVLEGNQWSTSSVYMGIPADRYALAYDSYNQANVVFSQGDEIIYGTKGVLTGNAWAFGMPVFVPGLQGNIDLALTHNDIPYIVYQSGDYLSYSTFDRMQGQWSTGIIDILGGAISNFCVASDLLGGIGVAYFGQHDGYWTLAYAYNDGSGLWDTDYLSLYDPFHGNIGLNFSDGIGLAFDYDNNPVISFSSGNGVWIAYDPVVVPEPATCALLLLGAGMLRRFRR